MGDRIIDWVLTFLTLPSVLVESSNCKTVRVLGAVASIPWMLFFITPALVVVLVALFIMLIEEA